MSFIDDICSLKACGSVNAEQMLKCIHFYSTKHERKEAFTKYRKWRKEQFYTHTTFDENGMHYEKSGANTSSTVNETGITVNDTSGSTSSELLFAGYDSTRQEALVRVANLYLTRYLGLSNWRIEQIQDSTYGTGIGFFYLG